MSQADHDRKVRDLAARVASRRPEDGFVSLDKGGESHFVPDPHDPRHGDDKLDIRGLTEILSLDTSTRVCVAEPGVTFRDLLSATLPHGLAPMLVPELETITLGGVVSGCAVESMAHRHGGFHDSCLEYEVVTGTGEIVTCSAQKNSEVFEMIHGSYGTLGVITKLRFRLIPAKPYVHLEYRHYSSFGALSQQMMACCGAPDIDFVDAIAHKDDSFVLCIGRFADEAPYTSDYRGRDIYYRSTAERREDYLTTNDYYFRFDADCHWATEAIPPMRTKLGRALFGRFFLGSTKLLRWARWLRPLEKHKKNLPVVTDVFIPKRRASEFFTWYRREVAYFPLWLVPYRMPTTYAWIADAHQKRTDDELYVDFAVYGLPNDRPDIDYSLLLEQKTRALGGIKTLISENHYDEETFWSIYDRPRYERIKRRNDPDNLFRGVYEKRVAYHRRRRAVSAEAPRRDIVQKAMTRRVVMKPKSPLSTAGSGGRSTFRKR